MEKSKTHSIVSLISKIRNNANKLIVNELKARGIHGLVTSHGDILMTLYISDGRAVSMMELAKKINKDKSTVTALVNKLIKLGYVQKTKSSEDGRSTNISLTEEGWELKPIFFEISEILIERIYSGLNDEEKEVIIKGLKKILSNF